MADSLRKVNTGEPLVIPAAAYNAFIDAARVNQGGRGRSVGAGGAEAVSTLVPVRNDSGADRARFEVLGISGTVFTPTGDMAAFQNYPVLTGVMPTAAHAGAFVVLVGPIAAGALGLGLVAGIVPVQINVTRTDHRTAEATNGDPTKLTSSATGSAQLLYAAAATGTQWMYVRLGRPLLAAPGTPYAMLPAAGATETEAAQTDTWDVTNQPAGKLGVKFRISRIAYNDAGDQKLYAYYRDVTTDAAGRIIAITAETRVEVDVPEAC
jgi:hypothetical protein